MLGILCYVIEWYFMLCCFFYAYLNCSLNWNQSILYIKTCFAVLCFSMNTRNCLRKARGTIILPWIQLNRCITKKMLCSKVRYTQIVNKPYEVTKAAFLQLLNHAQIPWQITMMWDTYKVIGVASGSSWVPTCWMLQEWGPVPHVDREEGF